MDCVLSPRLYAEEILGGNVGRKPNKPNVKNRQIFYFFFHIFHFLIVAQLNAKVTR
tara:strand:+ start:425 stop:592 length:168 start_codon:yes stop_codon:yes gene_type:complete